jgi:2-succinyl-6-hydroxy-2,4-cyclohexadiene-1-carboxylate synthase
VTNMTAENVVMLHGFSGTHRAWDGVVARMSPERYRPLALDLPGHGELAAAERPFSFERSVASVLDRSPGRFALVGYSMGGRVALHVALEAPERVERLLLVGANPGIEDAHERALRRESDSRLAEELEAAPFEDFVERWRNQPLFAGEPAEAGRLAREDQLRNQPDALAAVLRGMGTGEMSPLWSRLGELEMDATVLVGERDTKFQALGRRMVGLIPNAKLRVVAGGHGLPLENPQAIVDALS